MDSDDEPWGGSDSDPVVVGDYYHDRSDGDSGGGEEEEEGSDCAGDDYEVRDEVASLREKRYVVLSENDIRGRQEEAIRRVSSIFSIPRESASILLRQYKWNISKLSDEWFADEERVRHFVGLPTNGVVLPDCQEDIPQVH
ncbi:putative E3 ubiquitin-protein ligase ARI7 [Hordeum vulgare]|nr:putative E3 ubiquitin-protein ligase ARI7 [Hordeum vulgare]